MRWLTLLISALAFCLIVPLLLGLLQTLHGGFDSLSHFRLVFAGILVPVAILLLLARRWIIAGLSVICLGGSLLLTAPYLPGFGATVTGHDLRVVQFNMLYRNRDTDQIVQVLKNADADILILQELVAQNYDAFRALKKSHPFQLDCTAPKWGSVALASRFPIIKSKRTYCSRRLGFLSAELSIDGRCLSVASLHARWPWPFAQAQRLALLKPNIAGMTGSRILAGDFNAAPWSDAVQRVAGWFRGTVAPGLVLSWSPLLLEYDINFGLLLPLDHILYSEDLTPLNRTRLAQAGSDHRPILTEFVWTRPPQKEPKTCH